MGGFPAGGVLGFRVAICDQQLRKKMNRCINGVYLAVRWGVLGLHISDLGAQLGFSFGPLTWSAHLIKMHRFDFLRNLGCNALGLPFGARKDLDVGALRTHNQPHTKTHRLL